LVWKAEPWIVVAGTEPGRYRLIARSDKAATFRSTGSDSTGAPCGIVIERMPLKLRVRSPPAAMQG